MNRASLIRPLGALLLGASSGVALEIKGVKPDKIVVYKKIGSTELKLHVFNPAGHTATNRCPAIVFFFGGGWVGGTPTQFYPQCEYFASRGMVALSAEYRVKSTHGTSPRECVKDGKSAVRWIRQHARELGIDPDKLAAGGGSAGGHVAAATGTAKAFNEEGEDETVRSRPDALVLFNPVFDNGPGGYGHDQLKDCWKELSPMHNIDAQTPPAIVFLGAKDNLIPVATAEAFKKRMAEQGVRCDLHVYAGQPHGFFNYAHREFFEKTVIEADNFLTSLGFLKGKPEAPASQAKKE